VTAARARVVPPSARAGARTLHGRKSVTVTRQLQGCPCGEWCFRSTPHHRSAEIWLADRGATIHPPAPTLPDVPREARLQSPFDPTEEGRARLRRNTGNTSGDVASGPTPGSNLHKRETPGSLGSLFALIRRGVRIAAGKIRRASRTETGPPRPPLTGRPCATAPPQFARRARSGLEPSRIEGPSSVGAAVDAANRALGPLLKAQYGQALNGERTARSPRTWI
jgi:hypothetical protein